MRPRHGPVVPALLASVLGMASAVAADVAPEKTVVAPVAGAVGGSAGPAEAVVVAGHVSITGKIIHATVFGAPPVLELHVDLSNVRGRGQRTGKPYVVDSQAILHRPLVAFDPVEISFPFVVDGKLLLARSATASFGVYYSASKGMTTSPVQIKANPPS